MKILWLPLLPFRLRDQAREFAEHVWKLRQPLQVFLDGKLTRMSDIKPWIKEARYIPGQVWCPKDVPRTGE